MSSSTHNPLYQQQFKEQRAQQAAERAQRDPRKQFGTNSPPLEATGSARPMGMASVEGDVDAGYVLDGEQRKGYFEGEPCEEGDRMGVLEEAGAGGLERGRAPKREKPETLGQSLAMPMDERP